MNETPLHDVILNPYWIDQTEVTNAQYQKCVANGACTIPHVTRSYIRSAYYYSGNYANFPVIYIDWWQANSYCIWIGGRLPTEAEWEHAARSDEDQRVFPWGNETPVNIQQISMPL